MKTLRWLISLVMFAMFAGCSGGTKELPPPKTAPQMSEEAKKQMEETMKKGKAMMKKQGNR